ncbi:MAG: nitroreductase [Pseudomonadota bacterium]
MNVADALAQRKSIRAFLDKPVSDNQIRELLEQAKRAPSGGNVQPWRIYVINGESMQRFLAYLTERTAPETPAYEIYPPGLGEPYRSSRFKVGEDMYALLGIPRDDKPARIRRLMENYRFFGAPAGFFCFVDRQMGPPQWSDLGMFLQSFMLLATEAGLATCAQEAWATRPDSVAGFVGAPAEQMLFCGMAIGYADPDAPVNQLVSEREPFDVYARFV